MKTLLSSLAFVLLLGATAQGGWYYGPRAVYYPAPVYVAPAPVYPIYAAPVPVYAPAPVLVGPAPVVVRGRVYVPGRPVRNIVRAALPY